MIFCNIYMQQGHVVIATDVDPPNKFSELYMKHWWIKIACIHYIVEYRLSKPYV